MESEELKLYKAYRYFDNGDSDECYMINGNDYGKARNHFLDQTKSDEGFEYDLCVVTDQMDLDDIFEWEDVKSLKELYEERGTDLFW